MSWEEEDPEFEDSEFFRTKRKKKPDKVISGLILPDEDASINLGETSLSKLRDPYKEDSELKFFKIKGRKGFFVKKNAIPVSDAHRRKESFLKYLEEKKFQPRKSFPEGTYPYGSPIKDLLLEILRDQDHIARKKFAEDYCDCDCPISGQAILILFQTIAIELDISKKTIDWGIEVWSHFQKQRSCLAYQGKNRIAQAAALVYVATIATGDKRTQENIAWVSGTTPVSIRNLYKHLAILSSDLIDEKVKNMENGKVKARSELN